MLTSSSLFVQIRRSGIQLGSAFKLLGELCILIWSVWSLVQWLAHYSWRAFWNLFLNHLDHWGILYEEVVNVVVIDYRRLLHARLPQHTPSCRSISKCTHISAPWIKPIGDPIQQVFLNLLQIIWKTSNVHFFSKGFLCFLKDFLLYLILISPIWAICTACYQALSCVSRASICHASFLFLDPFFWWLWLCSSMMRYSFVFAWDSWVVFIWYGLNCRIRFHSTLFIFDGLWFRNINNDVLVSVSSILRYHLFFFFPDSLDRHLQVQHSEAFIVVQDYLLFRHRFAFFCHLILYFLYHWFFLYLGLSSAISLHLMTIGLLFLYLFMLLFDWWWPFICNFHIDNFDFILRRLSLCLLFIGRLGRYLLLLMLIGPFEDRSSWSIFTMSLYLWHIFSFALQIRFTLSMNKCLTIVLLSWLRTFSFTIGPFNDSPLGILPRITLSLLDHVLFI